MTDIAYVDNANTIELRALQDADETYVNDATVVLEDLEDASGSTVSGPSYPVSMTYVTDSDGVYRCTLADTVTLVDGASYTAKVKATKAGAIGRWNHPFTARTRTSR